MGEVGAPEEQRAPKSTRVLVFSQGSSAEDAAYIPWHPMELSSFRQQPVGCPRDTTLIELSTQLCMGQWASVHHAAHRSDGRHLRIAPCYRYQPPKHRRRHDSLPRSINSQSRALNALVAEAHNPSVSP